MQKTPEPKEIVINTGPLLAITAGLGDLSVLQMLYGKVYVPFEVCEEMRITGARMFAIEQFEQADWLHKLTEPLEIASFLSNSLDRGEAACVQLALAQGIGTVCIDEAAGRRIARLSGLAVTGSIGILIRARREGYPFSMQQAVEQMRAKGVWLSDRLIALALREAGEV